jgi:hypothetical protein
MLHKKSKQKQYVYGYGTYCVKRGGILPISSFIDIGNLLAAGKDLYTASTYDDSKDIRRSYLNMTSRSEKNRKEKTAEDVVNKMRELVKEGKGIQIY